MVPCHARRYRRRAPAKPGRIPALKRQIVRGSSKILPQGKDEPRLLELLARRGLDDVPLWKHRPPETLARRRRWVELVPLRDGPVSSKALAIDEAAASAQVKATARRLGADDVGIARLTPVMIDESADLPHDTVICVIVAEEYSEALKGSRAVENEATEAYARCAEIATELAARIRSMGYPARAHHNGAGEIMAIPAMHAAGLGELGKHGSLIHSRFGASHRPGFVTTTMPVAADAPIVFGVADTCMHCNLCANNCPGSAIPSSENYLVTEGVKRWLTDLEACYEFSRLRAQYCHICVDACPYVHKANGDPMKKSLYKRYMKKRKTAGYETPAWFAEDEAEILRRKG